MKRPQTDPLDAKPTRREFGGWATRLMGAAYVGSILYPVYRYVGAQDLLAQDVAATNSVVLQGAASLPEGAGMNFRFGRDPGLLVHLKDGGWRAFLARCTHLNCVVEYEPDADRIFCPCHKGVFDVQTGAHVAGPPPKPLTALETVVQGQDVAVNRTPRT